MCLIVIAHRASSRFPFVLAANRDEEYDRPSRSAHFWTDARDVLGGRDERHGGSWLALTRSGRIAAITNVRGVEKPGAPSRGAIVASFVRSSVPAAEFAASIPLGDYAGFHLIAGEIGGSLLHVSNANGSIREWPSGIHGISNAAPGTVWPKVERAVGRAADLVLTHGAPRPLATGLLALLATPSDAARDRGGTLREEVEDEIFVMSDRYGTRSSTVIIAAADAIWFYEQNYGRGGVKSGGVAEFTV